MKTKKVGLVVKSAVKAGGLSNNHNRPALAAKKAGLIVRSAVKSGGLSNNHNKPALAA